MELTLTKHDFRKFFFYQYFFMQNRLIGFMRMYMGPFLVVVAVYLFNEYPEMDPFAIGFAAAFGFIYSVRPVITLFALKFYDEKLFFKINNGILTFKDRAKEAEIDLSKNHLEQNKRYYFVKLDNGQVLFFPKEILSEKAKSIFIDHLRGES